MRRIREALRLYFVQGQSQTKVAEACGVSRTTVGDYIRRLNAVEVDFEACEKLDDLELEKLLYPQPIYTNKPALDFEKIHRELSKKGVTLQLLWQEYKSQNPRGYQYSQFCQLFKAWKKTIDVSLRQHYVPGEYCFIDYAGHTVRIHGSAPEDSFDAQVFVSALGASHYIYCEATRSQKKKDWLESHVRMLDFYGGVPKVLVPDNLRSGVNKACRYDPEINPSYADLARHYRCAVVPARPAKPRDKAKAETAVLMVERQILAPLRHQKFFNLEDLNSAIKEKLVELNRKGFQKISGSRISLFENMERSTLANLPTHRFVIKEHKQVKVQVNYHVSVEKHHYSVPYKYIGKTIEARYSNHIIELYFKNKAIASHPRSYKQGGYTTIKDHMPEKHQQYLAWTPERLINWAGEAGPSTKKLAEKIIDRQVVAQQGYNSVKGLISLSKKYGQTKLEQACFRALRISSPSYKTVKNILSNGLEDKPLPLPEATILTNVTSHENIRGAEFFNQSTKEKK